MLIKAKAQRGDVLVYQAKEKDMIGGIIAFFSDLGRKQSNITHVGIYAGRGRIIHSHLTVDPKTYVEGNKKSGCHMATIPIGDYKLIKPLRVPGGITSEQATKLIKWMRSQYKKGYDLESFSESWYRSVLARLLNWKSVRSARPDENSNHPDRWNCAEYTATAYKEALGIDIVPDLHPLNYTPADFVSPESTLEEVK